MVGLKKQTQSTWMLLGEALKAQLDCQKEIFSPQMKAYEEQNQVRQREQQVMQYKLSKALASMEESKKIMEENTQKQTQLLDCLLGVMESTTTKQNAYTFKIISHLERQEEREVEKEQREWTYAEDTSEEEESSVLGH